MFGLRLAERKGNALHAVSTGHIRYLKTPLRPEKAFRCQRAAAADVFPTKGRRSSVAVSLRRVAMWRSFGDVCAAAR